MVEAGSSSQTGMTTTEEQHVLLCLPDGVSGKVDRWLAGEGDVDMQFAVENGKAHLVVDGTTFSAGLCALPTIVETYKSTDGVTYFKSGEINSVFTADESASMPHAATTELAHGLTPPSVNIRKRKWRKRPVRDVPEVEQVAVELEALRGGSLKPDFELVRVEEDAPIDTALPSLKVRFAAPHAALTAEEPGKPSSAAGGQDESTLTMTGAPMSLKMTFNIGSATSGDAAVSSASCRALPAATTTASGLGHEAFGSAASVSPPSLSTAPRPSPQPEDHLHSQQQAGAEVQQLEEELVKYKRILSRVSNHSQRATVMAKIEHLTRLCDIARQAGS